MRKSLPLIPTVHEKADGRSVTQAPKTRPAVWSVCALLLLATLLNYLDRQTLALTADKIIDEFQLTGAEYGEILAAFRYSYALFQIVGGWLVDAFGARGVYAGAVALWSLAGMLTVLAGSKASLIFYRLLLGAGEAFNWPCALKTTHSLLKPKDRPLANGLFNSGSALGALIAPVVVTILTIHYGWRSAFVITGALGAVWIAAWVLLTRRYKKELSGRRMSLASVSGALRSILSKRAFWLLAVAAVTVNSVLYFLADWVPLYLKTERGFGFVAGNTLSMIVYAGLDVGNLLSGFFVRRLVSSGYDLAHAQRLTLRICCITMSSLVLTGLVDNNYIAIVFLVITATGVTGFMVIYLTLVQDVDLAYVGVVAGLLGGLGNLVYGFISPFLGLLADLKYTQLTFAVLAGLPWLAYLALSQLLQRDSR